MSRDRTKARLLALLLAAYGCSSEPHQPDEDSGDEAEESGDDAPSSGQESPSSGGRDAGRSGDPASRSDAGQRPTERMDGGVRGSDDAQSVDARVPLIDSGVKSPSSDASAPARPPHDGEMPSTGPSASADKTIIPHASWTCGMPDGIPSPIGAPLVFTAEFSVQQIRELGVTQFGKRQLIELSGGSVKGPKIDATLQKGGLDQPLLLANGTVELEQIVMLRTADGRYLYLRVCGVAPSEAEPVRVVMDFEAPNGSPYAFLNTAKLVGTRELDAEGKKITLRVHDVSAAARSAASIAIENPDGVVDQTWDCKEDEGTAGEEMFREVVQIGGSQSVGASKRGNRNAIPITGGTVTGKVKGKVLAGGADYQILGSGFLLDARYTLQADDGTLILVRNCGPASALIPVTETRADGPFAFLNENDWVSSSPMIGVGTVTLVISKKR